MKRLARALAGTLLLLLLSGGLAQGYYPAAPGYSWTYSSGETQALSGPRDMGGQQVYVLVHYYDGVPISEDYLHYSDAGVYSYGSAAGGQLFGYEPPLQVYPPEPLVPGQKWTGTTDLPGFSLTLDSEVLGLRGVSTPAGRFNALLIRQTSLTSTGGQTTLELYFVPGVGVVRFVTQDGSIIDLIERSF